MTSEDPHPTRRTLCKVCGVGRYEDTPEQARVPSNVRRWREHLSTVWRCGNCASLISLEVVDLEPFYDGYPYSQRKDDYFARRAFGRHLKLLEHSGVTAASSILDYGCSEGLFLSFLRTHGFKDCSGYDKYSERYSDEAALGREYDVVVCQDTIEHVDDPKGLLIRLAQAVRPGGVLCVGTPRADDVDLGNLKRSIHSLHQPYHLHILSERGITNLAVDAGFHVEALHRRHFMDTPYPFVNWRFLRAYLAANDDTLDAGFEQPRHGVFLRSPGLALLGLFGNLLPSSSEMIVMLRKGTGAT